jgi:hypothetical protein
MIHIALHRSLLRVVGSLRVGQGDQGDASTRATQIAAVIGLGGSAVVEAAIGGSPGRDDSANMPALKKQRGRRKDGIFCGTGRVVGGFGGYRAETPR